MDRDRYAEIARRARLNLSRHEQHPPLAESMRLVETVTVNTSDELIALVRKDG
jgi:hypothetical protein